MLHGKIAEKPGKGNDYRFQEEIQMAICGLMGNEYAVSCAEARQQPGKNKKGQENEGCGKGSEEKHGKYRIPVQGDLLEDFMKSQKEGRAYTQDDPDHRAQVYKIRL